MKREVLSLENEKVDLNSLLQDRYTLLLFYNNDCLGCTGRAIPLAHELNQEFDDLQVIGIHSNFGNRSAGPEDIASIFTIDLPFPIFIDEEHKLYDAFAAEGTPHWALIAPDLSIFRSFFGSQGGAQNRLPYAIEELLEGHKADS